MEKYFSLLTEEFGAAVTIIILGLAFVVRQQRKDYERERDDAKAAREELREVDRARREDSQRSTEALNALRRSIERIGGRDG